MIDLFFNPVNKKINPVSLYARNVNPDCFMNENEKKFKI